MYYNLIIFESQTRRGLNHGRFGCARFRFNGYHYALNLLDLVPIPIYELYLTRISLRYETCTLL